MKYIVLSDIHGMSENLRDLLKELKKIKNSQFIFLGDYIDRGPNSANVIDQLVELKEERNDSIFLMGNHEELMFNLYFPELLHITTLSKKICNDIDYMNELWIYDNGGIKTCESYNFVFENGMYVADFPKKHIDFFKSLKILYSVPNFIFVHAGMDRKKPLSENDAEDFLWIRPPFGLEYEMKRMIVHGHTPVKEVAFDNFENRINIDTGCVYGGKLSALVIDTENNSFEIFENK